MRKAMIALALLTAPAVAQAQSCITYRNDVVCSDGISLHRYQDGTVQVQRPTTRIPGPRQDIFIFRSKCLQANGRYGYCDEQTDEEGER